jgi:hypothetical protein
MSQVINALFAARLGFRVFPITPGAKDPPCFTDFPAKATTDRSTIEAWWKRYPRANVGISTNGLLALDIDVKNKANGYAALKVLEMDFDELPDTYRQKTPSGGMHYVYTLPKGIEIHNTVEKISPGLDTRGKGGYILGSGSTTPTGSYAATNPVKSVLAPSWLIDLVRIETVKLAQVKSVAPTISKDLLQSRGRDILRSLPIATLGNRNQSAYVAACLLRDAGLDLFLTTDMMLECFRSEPALSEEEIIATVKHAFTYAKEDAGSASIEAQFKPETEIGRLHPVEELNMHYAFCAMGSSGVVLWETHDQESKPITKYLSVDAFHNLLAPRTMVSGDGKALKLSRLWMSSPQRRTYEGVCFMPRQSVNSKWFNLWRGFNVKPCATGSDTANDGLKRWDEHVRLNICLGSRDLYQWVMDFFAHLVQKPWEKPLVALVLRGSKGCGKSSIVQAVGHLIGGHTTTVSDPRYLTGSFNAHLENCLMFILEEAFWSGEHKADSILKELITGQTMRIERKYIDSYQVRNLLRVVIIGNKNWIVPATEGERRYAVFDVRSSMEHNAAYFEKMYSGLKAGGYGLLMHKLLEWDISKARLNWVPKTNALLEQKLSGLSPFRNWWLASLQAGKLMSADFDCEEWSQEVSKEILRQACTRYCKENGWRIYAPQAICREIAMVCPSVINNQKNAKGQRVYRLPNLERARWEWDNFIGQESAW